MSPDRPPRIALLLPDLGGGGAERVFVNLAAALQGWGANVDVVVFRAAGPHLERLAEGVGLVDLGSGRALRSVGALARYLRDRRPDGLISALHTANLVALAAAALAGVKVPVVVTVHNVLEREFGGNPSLRARGIRALMSLLYPRARRVVAVSNGVRSSLERAGIATSRLETIYNPVVTDDMFTRAQESPPHPWLEAGGPPVIITLGRLEVQKDHATLLEAFALLRRSRSARLLILGEGGERPSLEERVERLGLSACVDLPGFIDNPYAALAHADLFVLSSRWEGLPTVLIEALALGLRVVSTDCDSGPSEILADGRYGVLVPVEDPEALAAALEEALLAPPTAAPAAATAPYRLEAAVDGYLGALGLHHGP